MRGATADGDHLKAARLVRGFTQERLAALAEVDVKTVRKAEAGGRLDLGTLARLATALDIPVSRLIQRSASENPSQIARREVVERWIASWDAQDNDAVVALYHADAVLRLPGAPQIPFGGTHRGKEAIRQANATAWATSRMVPMQAGSYSIVTTTDAAIVQGSKGIYLPDGKVHLLSAVLTFVFEGDLIKEHSVEYDTLTFNDVVQTGSAERPIGSDAESSR